MKRDLKDYFQTKSRREFFAGEELVAYDVDHALRFEMGHAQCGFGDVDGRPPMGILVHLWWKARDSWERVMLELPPGPDRDEMAYFLAERDEAMSRLREKALKLALRKLETAEGRREWEEYKNELQREKAHSFMEGTLLEVGDIVAGGKVNGR